MGVPGAVRRLWRDRPRVATLGLLAVTMLAASGLQTTSAIVLQQTLDQNWRGTYDILVTQAGKDPVTSGLLRSDALVDATGGRLSLSDLALIRSLPGVEVAAPIAEVSFAASNLVGDPVVWLPVSVRPDASLENPQAFRVTVSSETNDGVSQRTLASQTVLAFAYQPSYSQIVFDTNGAPLRDQSGAVVYATTDLADSPRLLSGDSRVTFASGAYDAASGTIPLGLSVAPRPAATVALVDPVSERALLGDAGTFLDPLLDTPNGIVVVDRSPSPLRLTVTVEEYEDVRPGVAGAEAVAQAQGTGFLQNGQIAPEIAPDARTTVVGDYELNAAPVLNPFARDPILLGGIDPALVQAAARPSANPAPRSVLGARYTISDDATGAVLVPRGYATYGQYTEGPLASALPGAVTEYSKLFGAVGSSGAPSPDLEVVGSFSPEQLRALVGDVSFMPLGAYDVVSPQLVADANGNASAPAMLASSLTGFGIPGTNDIAVGSFALLDGLGVDRPISAIRVRVSGIDAYTPDAQQRLLSAASSLGLLGYQATIVAGSSPQQLRTLVSGYALAATNSDGRQVIGNLGYIDQEWSRLGAVTEADTAVSATSVALLVVCILALGVLLAVVQLGSVPARREQSGVLRELGWRRLRIARWFAAEEVVGLGALVILGALALTLTTVPAVAGVSVAFSLLLVFLTSVGAVLLGVRSPRRTVRRQSRRELRVTGPLTFGAIQARTSLTTSVTLALALAVITTSVAIAVTVFVQGGELAGPTSLGAVASGRARIPQAVLAGASLAAGILLAVLSRRMNLVRRRAQWAGIRAMGWSRGEVRGAHVAELAVSAVPGFVVGLGLSMGIAEQLPGLLVPVALASSAAGILALVVVLLSAGKLD
ncbi:MAG: hypothetical protein KF761_01580 [Salinibacterium sp.]|nr:hypothetical protein [Salinibacterium sp.]